MRETVFLRLPEGDPQADIVCRLASEGSVASSPRRVALAQVRELAAGRRVVVFVPAAELRLTRVVVPVRQAPKALQATPFLLEDQFADDVETLHFALGARQADGSFPVAAVSRSLFESWLARLSLAGVDAHAVVPDLLALPWADDSWTALPDGDQVLVRSSAFGGFTAPADELSLFLKLAAGEHEIPKLRVLVPQSAHGDYSRLEQPVELAPGYADTLDALARHYRQEWSINLLQGPYTRHASWQQYLQPWRRVGGLAAAALVLGMGVNGALAFHDNRLAAAQEAANDQRFTALFPTERPTAYLAEQVAALARRGEGGDAGLLFLLQRFANAMSETPGLTLRALQYHDHALFLDLTGTNVEALEKLRAWFTANPGAKLEVQTADAGASGVQIRLKISAS